MKGLGRNISQVAETSVTHSDQLLLKVGRMRTLIYETSLDSMVNKTNRLQHA